MHAFPLLSLALRCLLLPPSAILHSNSAVLLSFYAIAMITFFPSLAGNAAIAANVAIRGDLLLLPTHWHPQSGAKKTSMTMTARQLGRDNNGHRGLLQPGGGCCPLPMSRCQRAPRFGRGTSAQGLYCCRGSTSFSAVAWQ